MNKYFIFIFIFCSPFLGCHAEEKEEMGEKEEVGEILPTSQSINIPLGGNTYITQADGPRVEKIDNEGISNWSKPNVVFSTYFRVSKTGELSLFVAYNAKADSRIQVKCSDETFAVSLKKGENQVAHIGKVNIKNTGYVKVDIQGLSREGDSFGELKDLVIDGTATTKEVNFVGDFSFYWGRRGPSVHLAYKVPTNEDVEWFYNEITVPQGEDPIGTYYMANGFGEGYFGIQVNSSSERRVLFSVWSTFVTDNPQDIPEDERIILLNKGERVHIGEFGNEGSGGQSYLVYPWKSGSTYKFLTNIKPDGKGATQYTSYFYTPQENKWMLIASFLRPKTDTYYKRPHSFLESFNPELGYLGRKAFYTNQWVRTKSGKWMEIQEAEFTADDTARKKARMDYKGGRDGEKFFLQNCGFLNDYTVINSSFERPLGNIEPSVELDQLPTK
ncbi:hypothetical protein AwDysgo_17160 [Bacteroidales bacterium]|nr:hypothetical protein AwDysgo_17160 [Bacteroidales bacterium]